ncbi:MAG: MG2 domain-containing protein [Candidatus Hinthialibacter antarcticus]|nr:MG2 domain-containing protein [Candidatus Hinthialibacter antarcticus]
MNRYFVGIFVPLFLFVFSMMASAQVIAEYPITQKTVQSGELILSPVIDFGLAPGGAIRTVAGDAFREGYQLTLKPGEGLLIVARDAVAIQSAGGPAVSVEYDVVSGDANVAVVAFNSVEGIPDGQIGLTQRMSHGEATPGTPERLVCLFAPPSGSMQPAVQVVNLTDVEARVALYSLAVRIIEGIEEKSEVFQSWAFSELDENIRLNINNDQGEPVYDAEGDRWMLRTEANQAANMAVPVGSIETVEEETLFYAKIDANRDPDADGTFASLFYGENWASGVFIKNENLKTFNGVTYFGGGGNFLPPAESLDLVLQNGAGANGGVVNVDNVEVRRLTMNSADYTPIVSVAAPKTLAAILAAPKEMFRLNQASFSINTLDASTRNAVSVPYKVMLTKDGESLLLGSGETSASGFDAKTFTVPASANGEWQIVVEAFGRTLAQGPAQIEDGALLLIETDKPIYQPGQKIQGRILLLDNTLRPLAGEVELNIADAKGIRIYKMTEQASDYGVVPFELPLASEVNMGTWKLTAESGDAKTELDLEIDRYVLPSFEIDVQVEKEWFLVDEAITGTIESNYFFGQPVKGEVKIEAYRYVSTWEQYAEVSGRLEDGRYEFELPPVTYAAGTASEEGDATLQLKLSVVDDGGKEELTDKLLRIVDAGVSLKLVNDSPVIKPGLQQDVLILSQTPNGAPLSTDVSIDLVFVDENGSTVGQIEDRAATDNGLLTYTYSVPADAAVGTFSVSASLDGKSTSAYEVLNAAYSPGAHFIHVRQRQPGMFTVGDVATFDVFSTNPGTVFYEVYSNGRTVFSQTSNDGVIEFSVQPQMSGSARLMVYMIQPNNEISADVLPFEVEAVASDLLRADFSAEEVRPGEAVTLQISTRQNAMVGVSIVDEAVYSLVEGRLNLQNIFAQLEEIFMQPQVEVHDDQGFGRGFPPPALKGAQDLLADNNLQIVASEELTVPQGRTLDPWLLFNNDLIRRGVPFEFFPFPEAVDDLAGGGAEKQYQEPDRVRTYFPETWLWEPEFLTSGDGGMATLELTAPDSITNWKLKATSTSGNGLGVAEAEIRVFQDFFVEPDLPVAVIRGDRFPMRVRVFNYIDVPQTVLITLENGDELGLVGDATREVFVPENGVVGVEFTLQPDKVGLLPVSLTAKTADRADAIRKNLRVEPEGMKRQIVQNGIIKDATSIALSFVPGPIFLERDDGLTPMPIEIVADSEKLRIAVTGSLLGQSLSGLGDLLNMPYGCGEQNMIFLAPDVEVLRYLDATGQSNPELRAQAEFFITTGYQRQLTFQHSDGSFSAFGESDESGSLWLTAFVLSTFSNAREVYPIDDNVIARAAQWIIDHQAEDGSWEPVGLVIHQEMDGGLEGNLGLSAYVLNALLEYGGADSTAVEQGLDFVASNISQVKNAYIMSLIAYSLSQAGHAAADSALDQLLSMAKSDKDGLYWEPHSIEATGYAIMALLQQQRPESQAALEWLSAQRNNLGGYGGTQDTVVAFKALTSAAIQQSRNLDTEIDVIVEGDVAHTFTVNENNFDIMQFVDIAPTQVVTLEQRGEGSVLYQGAYSYNVPGSETLMDAPPITLSVNYNAEHIEVDDVVDVFVSVMYAGGEEAGMSIVDVSVPTGFGVVGESIEKLRAMENIKRVEVAGRKVIVYLDNLASGEPFDFSFQVLAKFPVKADQGVSQAYLYYDRDVIAESQGRELVIE